MSPLEMQMQMQNAFVNAARRTRGGDYYGYGSLKLPTYATIIYLFIACSLLLHRTPHHALALSASPPLLHPACQVRQWFALLRRRLSCPSLRLPGHGKPDLEPERGAKSKWQAKSSKGRTSS
jgi:hypothetical protein